MEPPLATIAEPPLAGEPAGQREFFEGGRKLNVVEAPFGVTHTVEDNVQVFRVEGEIDLSTAPDLLERLCAQRDPRSQIVVDLTDVTFLDSTGLGVLVTARERVQSQSGQMGLVVSALNVMKVFEITGLTAVFSIFPTVADALRS